MALIDRQATSLLMAGSERVCAFDKAIWCGSLDGSGAPSYEFGNLRDSIDSLAEQPTYAPATFSRTE